MPRPPGELGTLPPPPLYSATTRSPALSIEIRTTETGARISSRRSSANTTDVGDSDAGLVQTPYAGDTESTWRARDVHWIDQADCRWRRPRPCSHCGDLHGTNDR